MEDTGRCLPSRMGKSRDFPAGPVLRRHAPDSGGTSSIPGRGTRSHEPQLRVHVPQLRPCAVESIHIGGKKDGEDSVSIFEATTNTSRA